MANAIQRANYWDYLAIANADASQRTSYWDYLPKELQIYIIRLAIRQHHRDQLQDVHQVLERFWDICNCGPFHLLCEIHFAKKWKVLCGIRQFLRSRNRVIFKHQICCRKPDPIYQRFAEEQEEQQ